MSTSGSTSPSRHVTALLPSVLATWIFFAASDAIVARASLAVPQNFGVVGGMLLEVLPGTLECPAGVARLATWSSQAG